MKAVSAVILTNGMKPGEVAAAGIMLGLVLLVLGVTGWIGRLARAIPQSVSAGLQLGLGLLMGVLGVKLMLKSPWIAFPALAALFLLSRIPRCPAAPLVLIGAAVAGWASRVRLGSPQACRQSSSQRGRIYRVAWKLQLFRNYLSR